MADDNPPLFKMFNFSTAHLLFEAEQEGREVLPRGPVSQIRGLAHHQRPTAPWTASRTGEPMPPR